MNYLGFGLQALNGQGGGWLDDVDGEGVRGYIVISNYDRPSS